jgi:SAM-dependent methyltransferase
MPAVPGRIPFDRVADRYDASRGGEDRGRAQVQAFLPWFADGPVVELGVGSGIIAAALAEAGRAPVGVDLSMPMLAKAAARIPGRVARGDVLEPPFRRGSAGTVVAVHVFHLVPDVDAAVVAAVELLRRPGGRLVVTGIDGNNESDDELSAIDRPVSRRFRIPPTPQRIASIAAGCGATLVHDGHAPRRAFTQTPRNAAAALEDRLYSWCWEMGDDVFEREIRPVIDAMLALPDPDRPRDRWAEWRYVVLEAT